MSKLSVHVNQNPTGLKDILGECYRAGSPITILYSVNQNIGGDIRAVSPSSKWVYRRQTDTFNRLPGNFWQGDPVASATNWLIVTRDRADMNRTQLENIQLNNPDYADVLNEPSIEVANWNDPAQVAEMVRKAQWLNTWVLTALEITHQRNVKLALFSFPTESPPLEVWQHLLPCLRLGKQYGAIISIHAYNAGGEDDSGALHDHPQAYLRYRSILAQLPEDAQLPFIISEAGANNGFNTGTASRGYNFVDDLIACDVDWLKDPLLWSACAYQLGGSESNMAVQPGVVEHLEEYVATHPTNPTPPPPPVIVESPDGTTIPPAAKIIDSQLRTWTFGTAVPMGYVILREGAQFAGGQGNLLLYYNHFVYARNANNDWFIATEATWVKIDGDPRAHAQGIDVSIYQGAVNWVAVKAAGKPFAFIKATQGNTIIDPQFAANWTNAKAAGVYRGAYHYFKFNVDPLTQASYFCTQLAADRGELPPVVDVEDTSSIANSTHLKQFIDAVTATLGIKPIIYTGAWFWNPTRWGGNIAWAKNYDLWIADYTAKPEPTIPVDWSTYQFRQYSSSGTVNGISGAVDLDYFNGSEAELKEYVAAVVPVPPPAGFVYYGLSAGTQNEIPDSHAGIYGSGFSADPRAAFKFMTLPDAGMMTRSINRIRARNTSAFMMARIFFSVGNTPFTPQDFVNYSYNGTQAAYAAGLRDFEVHNEPNLTQEGLGLGWADGYSFGVWLKEVLYILKQRYPSARFWFPGLSPQEAAPQFLSDALSVTGLAGMLYGYGFHSYWYTETGGQWNMVDESGGLSWKKLWRVLPATEQAKPKAITEFSNNAAAVPAYLKGQQYKRYRSLLLQNGVHSAFSFVLYWDGDQNHENWCNLNGTSTSILEGYKA